MNKELFVSSTPHETKVGLVEDDLLAEIYLERENEYTLAGSIYKGRVTRVLPGMQSAFVDIGLERDAFLYVSDFMELEEHDDDLTDVVPATRGVPDLRPQPPRQEAATGVQESAEPPAWRRPRASRMREREPMATPKHAQPAMSGAETAEPTNGSESGRERGGWRGRRRRGRGGRRDRGFERGGERGERAPEPRFSRPVDTAPSRPAGPPAGYTPILLPGESISKYQRFAQQASVPEMPSSEAVNESSQESCSRISLPPWPRHSLRMSRSLRRERPVPSLCTRSTKMSGRWPRRLSSRLRLQRTGTVNSAVQKRSVLLLPLGVPKPAAPVETELVNEEVEKQSSAERETDHLLIPLAEEINPPAYSSREEQTPVFAAPGTMEEETIDEEEADTIHYESSSDEGYDEFEEETRAADQLNGDAREAVTEIHMASLAESGEAAGRGSSSCGRRGRQRGN